MKINNPIKTTLITLMLLMVSFTVGCLQPFTDQNQQTHLASKIIERINETYESIEGYEAEIRQIDVSGNSYVQAQFHILFLKPDKMLIRGDYSIEGFNGSIHWIYDKSRNEVRIDYINRTPDLFGFVVKELKSCKPKLEGKEKVNGRECYLLNLSLINLTSNKSIQLRKVCIANESGKWYPVKMVMVVNGKEVNQKQINQTKSNKTEATVILKLRGFREVKEVRADINKFNFSPPVSVTKIFSYNYKMKKKVNQLTEDEILDICLSRIGYRNWNHSIYDSTPYYRKNASKDVTIYLEKGGSGFKAECHIGKNVSVRLTRLGVIKSPFVEDQEKIIRIAKTKVNATYAINATPLFAYEIYNLATRKAEEYRVVLEDKTKGYIVSVRNGEVSVKEVKLLKDLRPFDISIYNLTPLNQSPITLCAVMRYEGNLPRIIYYGGISPLAMLVFDLTRNIRIEVPLIKPLNLEERVIEPGDKYKRCFTFDLFEGKYEAIPYAEIALEDPLDCFKRYNDTDVAELKCYLRIYSHSVRGSLDFKVERIAGKTLDVFRMIAEVAG
jgi:outer membrane lipoprotein-sorting protein